MLYKWLVVIFLLASPGTGHPIFVSVAEVEHNAKDQSLEISCKIFTDDFETTLRKLYNVKVDLLDDKMRPAMTPLVNTYIQQHFSIKLAGKVTQMQFIGYEQQEEGIVAFYEVKNVPVAKSITIKNNILYEYKEQQMGIIHVTVSGERKSRKLNNPEAETTFEF